MTNPTALRGNAIAIMWFLTLVTVITFLVAGAWAFVPVAVSGVWLVASL